MSDPEAAPPIRVRRSKIHGTGVFATRAIPKGVRLVEYVGERVSHAEADRRYAHKPADDNHTFLFTVDARTVIDGGRGGNDARFINHSCDPNCETVVEDRRIYIETIRPIAPGEEIAYDYMIERDHDDPPDIDAVFGCRCGSDACRGTMLLPPQPRPARSPARAERRQPRRRA
jgi:SET domain-containing protein